MVFVILVCLAAVGAFVNHMWLSPREVLPLMRLPWHRVPPAPPEEVEIRAPVSLFDVADVHLHVAAVVGWRRRFPFRAPPRQLVVRDVELEPPRLDIELDEVPVAHQRQRAPDSGFRADVKDDGALGGAAHACVRDPDHVGHTRLQHGRRQPHVAHLGHTRVSDRSTVSQHEDA